MVLVLFRDYFASRSLCLLMHLPAGCRRLCRGGAAAVPCRCFAGRFGFAARWWWSAGGWCCWPLLVLSRWSLRSVVVWLRSAVVWVVGRFRCCPGGLRPLPLRLCHCRLCRCPCVSCQDAGFKKNASGPGPAEGHTLHGSLALVGLLVVPCSFAVQQCVSCTVHVAVERPPALHAQSFRSPQRLVGPELS